MKQPNKAVAPNPAAPVAVVDGEALTRLQVVERSRKVLRMLAPLAGLVEELSRLDSLDRELEAATVRNKQAEDEAADVLGARMAEIDEAERRGARLKAEAQAAAGRIVANAKEQLAQADARAAAIIEAAVKRAGEVNEDAAAKVAAAQQQLASLEQAAKDAAERAASLREVADKLDARVAAAQKQVAKMLGQA